MEEQIPEDSIVLHEWNIIPPKSEKTFCAPDAKRLKKKKSNSARTVWTVSDIAKAASLLMAPPLKTDFSDEQEMRRVYTLIYDVFRYKSVLNQALQDIAFFLIHPQLLKEQCRIWLLLYDMYHRGFKKREVRMQLVAAKMFADCQLTPVEDTLWTERVKLAAAIARLRIEKSALKLSDLLPRHLRDEKINNYETAPVTCWVNIRKSKNKNALCDEIASKLGLSLTGSDFTLGPNHFKWDAHCPHFLVLHPSMRVKLAQSALVKRHKLIVQSKAFCVGPATFGKIISDLQLTGSVIQTHVNSPRTVAYLATLLSQNENIKKLMAFSAGSRKKEYENYFSQLGMKNILIYSEKLIDMSPDSHCLEEVIAVFATPPNSYSAITDPIDLVCGRGGDLSMLEILTESEETKQTKERVASILDEQRKTLRFAMSRPQIQFVLYETHSELDAENTGMVAKAMKEINRIAKLHHATLQGKIGTPQPETAAPTEINNNEKVEQVVSVDDIDSKDSTLTIRSDQQSITSKQSVEEVDFDEKFQDVVVPDCDIFDLPAIPDLCPNLDKCTSLNKEGCYLALLQRKVVTNMDNKYMIQMAEARGLFGNANQPSAKKSSKSSKAKKQERAPSPTQKPKKKAKQIEIETSGDNYKEIANLESNCSKNVNQELESNIETNKTSKNGAPMSPNSSISSRHPLKRRKRKEDISIISPGGSVALKISNKRKKGIGYPSIVKITNPAYNSMARKIESNGDNDKEIGNLKGNFPKNVNKELESTIEENKINDNQIFMSENSSISSSRSIKKRKRREKCSINSPDGSVVSKGSNKKRKRVIGYPSIVRIATPTYSSTVRKCPHESYQVRCEQCHKRNTDH